MYDTAKSARNTTALIEQCDIMIRLEPIHNSFVPMLHGAAAGC